MYYCSTFISMVLFPSVYQSPHMMLFFTIMIPAVTKLCCFRMIYIHFIVEVIFSCFFYTFLYYVVGTSWSWWYGSWINNYLCNQCLSSTRLWGRNPLITRCTRYNIMWKSLSVSCCRSAISSTNTTDLHDITATLLKVVLNTRALTL